MPIKTKFLNFFRWQLWKLPFWSQNLPHWTEGQEISSWQCKLPPNPSQFLTPTWITTTQKGFVWQLDLSQLLEWHLFFGIREIEFEFLFNKIKPQTTIIDIGTNFGYPALEFSRRVGPNGKVFCFEPLPENFRKLKYHVQENNLKNINLFPIALGNSHSEIEMELGSPNNAGQAKIISSKKSQENKKLKNIKVQQIPLDSFIDEKNISKVDLLKIDVEGYEYKVLQGAKKLLQRDHPYLFIEVSDLLLKEQNSSAQELMTFLTNHSYNLFCLPQKKPITNVFTWENCHMNIWAEPITPPTLDQSVDKSIFHS